MNKVKAGKKPSVINVVGESITFSEIFIIVKATLQEMREMESPKLAKATKPRTGTIPNTNPQITANICFIQYIANSIINMVRKFDDKQHIKHTHIFP